MESANSLGINLMFAGIAALMVVLGVPLVLGKVKPNALYGFRTARTLSSPAVWYLANRAAGWALVV